MTNWRRLCRLRIFSCYMLLIFVCLWLVLCLYDVILRTTSTPWHKVNIAASVESSLQSRMFKERPLVLLTLSYHATPIYDLMDQLEPLGVQFIECGMNAYSCQYFNTCRHHDPLKVSSTICFSVFSCLHLFVHHGQSCLCPHEMGVLAWSVYIYVIIQNTVTESGICDVRIFVFWFSVIIFVLVIFIL